MNIDDIREYYLSFPHVTECFPFGDDILVFKVGSKMFGLSVLGSDEPFVQLKCNPDRAIDLREHYEGVEPAWHMNKVHWNRVYLNRDLRQEQVLELVAHSYELVWSKLSKSEKQSLQETIRT